MSNNNLGYFKLTPLAYEPVRGSMYSAGYDLKSAYDYIIQPHDKQLIKTDLSISLPNGTYGRIAPRSGLALNHFINVGAGVIDRDYTGNVGILLFNHSNSKFRVKRGDRVAQLICEKIVEPILVQLNEPPSNTERGDGGFGSTGN